MQRREFGRSIRRETVAERKVEPTRASQRSLLGPILFVVAVIGLGGLSYIVTQVVDAKREQPGFLLHFGRIYKVADNHKMSYARLRFYLALVVCDEPEQDHQLQRLNIENFFTSAHQKYVYELAAIDKLQKDASFCSAKLPLLREEFHAWRLYSNDKKLIDPEKPQFKFLGGDFVKTEIDRLLAATAGTTVATPGGSHAPAEGALVSGAAIEAPTSEPLFDPKSLCSNRYPSDYSMRKVCERSEEQARFTASNMQIDTDVGITCTRRYPREWNMFVVCAKDQMKSKLPDSSKPDRPEFSISTKCKNEYPEDYHMQDYCIKKQEDARSEAKGREITDEIAIKCTSDYPSDWSMFLYCVRQQTKAKSSLE